METPPEPGYAAYPRAGDSQSYYFSPPPMRVRIEVVSEAWNLVRKDFSNWIVAVIVAGLVPLVCTIPYTIYLMSIAGTNIRALDRMSPTLLAVAVPTYLVAGVATALIVAGLQRMGLKKIRGEYASIGDVFNLEGMFWQVAFFGVFQALIQSVIPQVLASTLFRATANSAGGFDQFASTFAVLGFTLVCTLVFALFFVLSPLLIVDQKLGAFEAMGTSARTLAPFLPILFLTLLAGCLFSLLGILACCVGVLFTAPIQYAMCALIYHDFYRPAPQQEPPGPVAPPPQFRV